MTIPIFIVLGILGLAVLFFVTEWLPIDLVALLTLLSLTLTGLISHSEALQGFANPAVITIASVLVLSGALTQTGVAKVVGRQVLRLAGDSEIRLLLVMMLTVGLMSGVMNNIGVAALLLPVVLDIARRTGQPPSKLLIPLAFGSLLGGLTTLIGTAPNILVSSALESSDLEPFSMFDFLPVGLTALAAGVLYMVVVGRHLLPVRQTGQAQDRGRDLLDVYGLDRAMYTLSIPDDSPLVGGTVAESRLGLALGLTVLAISRNGDRVEAPGPEVELRPGDELLVEGRMDQLEALRQWKQLVLRPLQLPREEDLASASIGFAEVEIAGTSKLVGLSLRETDFGSRFGVKVLSVVHEGKRRLSDLGRIQIRAGDTLLVLGLGERLDGLRESDDFATTQRISRREATRKYGLLRRLMRVEVPEGSRLSEMSLAEARLSDAFGLMVLALERDGELQLWTDAHEKLNAGDVLLLQGREEDLFTLHALQNVRIDERPAGATQLESREVGLAEVILSPRTSLLGKSLQELFFREKYGLTVIAIWRGDRSYHSNIRVSSMKLEFGDALLVYGSRRKLEMLARDPEFLVLTEEEGRGALNEEKAPVSALVMTVVVASVATGLVPIFIAAPTGAACMVLTRCITMEEAYRFIEWNVIILIAGMLGLGLAMQETGAAGLVARSALGAIGQFGPRAVVAGLFLLTAISAQLMPTAAVAVLMAPIALSTASDVGLSPHALMMAVAIGSSSAFLSPVGHPVNLLVMGLGGYRFGDYTKVGLGLVVLMLLITVFILPRFWPLVV